MGEILSLAEVPFPAGRYTYQALSGLIEVVLDTARFDFHIDASPDADPNELEHVLEAVLFARGFELVSEDECEPDTLDNGWTRIHATPVSAVADLVEEPDMAPLSPRERRTFSGNAFRAVSVAALAASTTAYAYFGPAMELVTS